MPFSAPFAASRSTAVALLPPVLAVPWIGQIRAQTFALVPFVLVYALLAADSRRPSRCVYLVVPLLIVVLVVVALICFFPIAVNATDGLRSVDPEATKMMRTLNGSRLQVLWRLEWPTSLPFVFSGARIAAAFAPIAAIFGEWAGANTGLGVLIREDSANLQTARMFAAAAILSAIALLLYGSIAFAERRVVTWR